MTGNPLEPQGLIRPHFAALKRFLYLCASDLMPFLRTSSVYEYFHIQLESHLLHKALLVYSLILGHCDVVQLLSHVGLFVTPCTAACQASLSFTISWSLLKLESIESVMASNHLILCHPLSFQWKLPWCWKRLTAGGKGGERGHYSYSLKLVIVRAFTPQKLASTTDQDFGIVMIIVLIADLPAHCCTYLIPQQSFDPNSLASPCWSLLCHVPVCVSYRDCRRNRIIRFFVSLQYHHDTMWNVSTLQCLLILFISPAWVQFFSKNFQMLSTWLKKKSSL